MPSDYYYEEIQKLNRNVKRIMSDNSFMINRIRDLENDSIFHERFKELSEEIQRLKRKLDGGKVNMVGREGEFHKDDIIKHFKRETLSEHDMMRNLYLYRFIGFATHTETKEEVAVYSALYNDPEKGISYGQIFVRPKNMFLSEVDHEKYPNIKQKYRLEKVCLY